MDRLELESEYPEQHPDLYTGWLNQYTSIVEQIRRAEHGEEEEKPDTFLAEELIIASLLGNAMANRSASFIDNVENLMLREDHWRLADAVAEGSAMLGDIIVAKTEQKIRSALATELRKGASWVGAPVDDAIPRREVILDGLTASIKTYANTYYDKFVAPVLQDMIDREFVSGPGGKESFRKVQKLLNNKLKETPYWRVVANAEVSRSYHYGVLKSAQFNGQRGYQIIAIIDRKTSDICLKMDGQQFWIEDAAQLVEQSATSEDPETVKQLQPWLKYSEARDLTSSELMARGVMVPPFHGNCRSTIDPIAGF